MHNVVSNSQGGRQPGERNCTDALAKRRLADLPRIFDPDDVAADEHRRALIEEGKKYFLIRQVDLKAIRIRNGLVLLPEIARRSEIARSLGFRDGSSAFRVFGE